MTHLAERNGVLFQDPEVAVLQLAEGKNNIMRINKKNRCGDEKYLFNRHKEKDEKRKERGHKEKDSGRKKKEKDKKDRHSSHHRSPSSSSKKEIKSERRSHEREKVKIVKNPK